MTSFADHPSRANLAPRLFGRRVMLRPLTPGDFDQFSEVRVRNEQWLTIWEPARANFAPDPSVDRDAFAARCSVRDRERMAGNAHPFGLFVNNSFAGEVNLNNVTRGAMQSATVGYWIDQQQAGHSYIAEGVAVLARYAFEDLGLHRLEICIVPRNDRSHRVMQKLRIRHEGIALRYLEINGVWEDHVRYGITVEEWRERRNEFDRDWLSREN